MGRTTEREGQPSLWNHSVPKDQKIKWQIQKGKATETQHMRAAMTGDGEANVDG